MKWLRIANDIEW